MSLREELGFPNPIESRPHEAIMSIIVTGSTIIKEGDKILKGHGLTVTQLNVLMILRYQAPSEGITQTRLGDMLLVNRSNVTGLVDRMEKAGFVVRREDPEDRRAKVVSITETGVDVLAEAEKRYFEVMDQVMGEFSKKDVDALCRQLEKIREHLKGSEG